MEDAKEAPALTHIQKLVAEEHRLFDKEALDDSEKRRLATIQVELDQCWDLLRRGEHSTQYGQERTSGYWLH